MTFQKLLDVPRELTAFDAADRLLLLHAALFTLRDKPAFAAHGAQNAALDDFLAKAFEQGILRFAIA